MSTVRLKKAHGERKAGETISVPFAVGCELVDKGVAEYPPSSGPAPASAKPTEFAALTQRNAALAAENDELRAKLEESQKFRAENGQLKKDKDVLQGKLEAADAEIASLTKKLAEAKK